MNVQDDIMFEFERYYQSLGFKHIVGIDEAGRGALVGSVVVAGVIFPQGVALPNVNDSKVLTHTQRLSLREEILSVKGVCYAIVEIDEKTIDRMNIFQATMVGMQQVVMKLSQADFALIDGNKVPRPFPIESKPIVGGDGKSASIAAASILAKTHRDALMENLAIKYPQYGFEIHKGYGTFEHIQAIKKEGVLPEHRVTFSPIKEMLNPFIQGDLLDGM